MNKPRTQKWQCSKTLKVILNKRLDQLKAGPASGRPSAAPWSAPPCPDARVLDKLESTDYGRAFRSLIESNQMLACFKRSYRFRKVTMVALAQTRNTNNRSSCYFSPLPPILFMWSFISEQMQNALKLKPPFQKQEHRTSIYLLQQLRCHPDPTCSIQESIFHSWRAPPWPWAILDVDSKLSYHRSLWVLGTVLVCEDVSILSWSASIS